MIIYNYLKHLQQDIFRLSPQEIEKKYFEVCKELTDSASVQKIFGLSMKDYEKELDLCFQKVMNDEQEEFKAIYFEYDMDNEWSSRYYLCTEYYEIKEENEDWACEWDTYVEGPNLPLFTQIYEETGGFDLAGTVLCLIVKTVVSFLRVVQKYDAPMPVCIGYHDQDPIMRMKEE